MVFSVMPLTEFTDGRWRQNCKVGKLRCVGDFEDVLGTRPMTRLCLRGGSVSNVDGETEMSSRLSEFTFALTLQNMRPGDLSSVISFELGSAINLLLTSGRAARNVGSRFSAFEIT